MGLCNDRKATLLRAARQAKDIGSYLVSFPNDRSVIEPLRKAASTIDEAARTLGQKELIDLSTNLSYAAHGIISTTRGVDKLNRIICQILMIAESFTERAG